MKTWAVPAGYATITSGISFGVLPVLGTASLDGFAIGALLTGAYFAFVHSPERVGTGSLSRRSPDRRGTFAVLVRRRPAGTVTVELEPRPVARAGHDAPTAWQPRHAYHRTEESHPYPQADAVQPDAPEPDAIKAAAPPWPALVLPRESGSSGRFARARRRVDGMIAQMVSDDPEDSDAFDSKAANWLEQGNGDFWGPDEHREVNPPGYRSRHRLTDPSKAPKRADGERGKPRHAAPPSAYYAALSRRMAKTSRQFPAHAAN